MNVNNDNVNPETATEANATEGEARVSRETEAATADNAADAATDDDNDEEQQETDTGLKQVKLSDLTDDLDLIGEATGIAKAVAAAVKADLDAIRVAQTGLDEAAGIAEDAKETRTGLWGHVLNVTLAVADATTEHPEFREMVYGYTMGPFLKEKQRSTAKNYASTGKKVLLKLLTDEGMDPETVRGMAFADIRDALKPAKSADRIEAERLATEAKERISFILRYASAEVGGEEPLARLQRIAEAVERDWNPVKRAKDAATAAEKGAAALQELKQQSPREATTAETVAPRPQVPVRHVVRGEGRAH